MTEREQDLAVLDSICDVLNPDEMRILRRVADKLYAGQSEHGYMDIEKDHRDFYNEAMDEAADGLVYALMLMEQGRQMA